MDGIAILTDVADGDEDIYDGGIDAYAAAGGGILLDPLFDLVLFVFDAINAILQRVMLSDEENNGIISNIVETVKDSFLIMSSESKDEEFDSGTINQEGLKVRILQKYNSLEFAHIHYSCEEIFAGKIGLLNIDFISGEGQSEGLGNVRKVIASWYKTLRLIAIIGFLSVLIYTGIKIMISSSAEDKAKYKEWIINWFIGIAILFFLHYIMSFIITVIGKFNSLLGQSMQYIHIASFDAEKTFVWNNRTGEFNTNLIGLVRFLSQSSVPLFKVGYLILYVMLTTFTIKFTFVYLKRLINMAFLTLIAPIVAFTYPLDKLSDGQAQGFNMWIKEYIFNALLQPMHLLLYYILVGSAVIIAAENPIYAIAVLSFMAEGERLLKKIFGFEKAGGGTVKGMQDAVTGAALAGAIGGILGRGKPGVQNQNQGKMNFPGATNKDYQNAISPQGDTGSGGGGGAPLPSGNGKNDNNNNNNNNKNKGNENNNNNNKGKSGTPKDVPPPKTPQKNPVESKDKKEPIEQKAARRRNAVKNGVKALGKKAVKPIWDFDKSGKYNGKRLTRNLAKAAIGTGIGLTAAAVQAGISLTDGKYNPAEGIATFAAGYGLAGRQVDNVTDTFARGYTESLSKEERMEAYQENFRDRDDVIQFCKDNYGEDWKEYRDRMADNFVPRGFTNLDEMKEMMKFSKAVTGDTKGLSKKERMEKYKNNDILAMSIKNVQKRKKREHSLNTAYNSEKQANYIAAQTQGMSQDDAENKARQIKSEDAAIRRYNDIVKS